MADLQRPSIPSVVDGLTPDQRKILFCLLNSKSDKEIKVSKLSAHVSQHTACHRHDEQRLATAAIRMTHSFVGSNNINLLHPVGYIGTRNCGGEDCAAPEYIVTKLLPITRSIFHKDDDALLDYLNEDGKSIEPTWYVPILPMILVNGGEGSGTGCSTYIPNYNPRDIIANLRRLLNDEYTKPMHPWYRGFKGSIEKTNAEVGGDTYTATGVIEAVGSTRLRITELPIRCWTMDYRDFLETLASDVKKGRGFIENIMVSGCNEDIDFEVVLSEENMNIAKKEGLENKFKLTSTIGTSNMHLLDSDGNVQKYDTPEQILEEFFKVRLEIYEKRKIALLEKIEPDLRKLNNEVRFIHGIVHGDIIVSNRKRAELLVELRRKNFDPFPMKLKAAKPPAEKVNANDYEYLLSMPISTLTQEKMQKLINEKGKLENEVEKLRQTSPRSLWLTDLDALENELDALDRMDEEAAEEMRARREAYGRTGFVPGAARKRAFKKITDKTQKVECATSKIAGTRAAKRKKPCKEIVSVSDSEEEGVPVLKERLTSNTRT